MKFQVGGGVLAPNIWVGESIIGLFDFFCLFVCIYTLWIYTNVHKLHTCALHACV